MNQCKKDCSSIHWKSVFFLLYFLPVSVTGSSAKIDQSMLSTGVFPTLARRSHGVLACFQSKGLCIAPVHYYPAYTTANSGRNKSVRALSLFRELRKVGGAVISGVGLAESVVVSLFTDRSQFRRLTPTVQALELFLNKSGIGLEFSNALTPRFLTNLAILSRIQTLNQGVDDEKDISELPFTFNEEETRRYMRYATAVYGSSMIRAAELDAKGEVNTRLSPLTLQRISHYIGVKEIDITLADVDFGGEKEHLRFFVAVDHIHKAVVLSIRGTFTVPEIVVDVVAFSRPFAGGEAHSAIADIANRTWSVAEKWVLDALKNNTDYELVLTGHSLGAGVACLLNILCHENDGQRVNGRKVRCFAFASPPVFSPLSSAPDAALKNALNFIHGNDVVPFLSVDSVRNLCASIIAIDNVTSSQGWLGRFQLASGVKAANETLKILANKVLNQTLEAKEGAPALYIPVERNIWLTEIPEKKHTYHFASLDSGQLRNFGIRVHARMITDHFPPRYESALNSIYTGEDEKAKDNGA